LHGSRRSSEDLFQTPIAAAQVVRNPAVSNPGFEQLVVFANERVIVQSNDDPDGRPGRGVCDGPGPEVRRMDVEHVRSNAEEGRNEGIGQAGARPERPIGTLHWKHGDEPPGCGALDAEVPRAWIRDVNGAVRGRRRAKRGQVDLDTPEPARVGRAR
jgi:hypothetical protein